MKALIKWIAVENGVQWGVWIVPAGRRHVWRLAPVAVFDTEAQANAYALTLNEPSF